MKIFSRLRSLSLICILLLNSCVQDYPERIAPVVIGIPSDVESLNPLFAFSGYETIITELLYPALVQYEWNLEKGNLDFFPMLAERWEWNADSTSITFFLHRDAKWRDGHSVTARDIIFSFDMYSDPQIQSRLFGGFNHFILEEDLSIDIEKTFQSNDPYIVTVNFSNTSVPDLKYFDMPMIPEHIFGAFDKGSFFSLEKGLDSVTCGAFFLYSWDQNQSIILKKDEQPFINKRGNVSEIIFKVIPDYNSRLTQMKRGEIHLMEDIKTGDIDELMAADLNIEAIKGKEYDYIGWNNISPHSNISTGTTITHPLFGTAEVRRALSIAINRQEIFEEFMQDYGSLASGPVSPIFTGYYDSDIFPLEFNPKRSKEILKGAGWTDADRNGILEKNGKEFTFTLNIPSGNPRREYAAAIIKNNLRAVGVKISVEPLESGVFFDRMFSRKLDAWLAGWVIPVPLDLYPYWHSDLKNAQMNVVSYRSIEADSLLKLLSSENDEEKKTKYIKQVQKVIAEDQPVTFMYWIDNLISYNNNIENIKITPLGPFHHCWTWSIK